MPRVCLVADDEALVGIEHGQSAPHVVERRLEARVELLQRLIALQGFGELLLDAVLGGNGFLARSCPAVRSVRLVGPSRARHVPRASLRAL